jgi:tetratricopeptide (TPR) repeat protein
MKTKPIILIISLLFCLSCSRKKEHTPIESNSIIRSGRTAFENGDFLQAAQLFEEALKEETGRINPDEDVVYFLHNEIGTSYDHYGNFDKALVHYELTHSYNIQSVGESHPDTATSYNNIGYIMKVKGDLDSALINYEKAKEIFKDLFGESNSDYLMSLNNIGSALIAKKKYRRGIEYLLKVESNGALEQEMYGVLLSNIATAYDKLNEYDKALNYYDKSLKADIPFLNNDHPDIATTYSNIAGTYLKLGKRVEAKSYYLKAVNILINKFGPNHPNTEVVQAAIDKL